MKKLVVELVNGHQLDLFDLMAACEVSESAKAKKKRMKVVRKTEASSLADETGDYLGKGQRIETLARERFAKVIEGLTFSTLEEKIYAVPYNVNGTLFDHVKKIAKVFRSYVSEMDLSKDSEDYKALSALIDFDFELRSVDYDSESCIGAVRRLRYRMKKSADQLYLKVSEPGFPDLHIFGYRAQSVAKSYLMTDRSTVGDIGIILAWLFIFTLYNRSISDPTMEGALSEAFSSSKPLGATNYDDLMRSIWVYTDWWRLVTRKGEGEDERQLSASEIFDNEINRQKTKIVLPLKEYARPSAEAVDEFKALFNLQNVDIPVTTLKRSVLQQKNREAYNASNHTEISQWALPTSVEYGIVSLDPVHYFKKGLGKISYNQTLERHIGGDTGEAEYVPPAWPVPCSRTVVLDSAYGLINETVKAVWEEKSQVVSKLKYYKDMESGKSVAKAYQTKKAIPLKVLKEMEESDFNNYFGYVEIDESCDLGKVRALADEFSAFKNQLLKGADFSEVSLRFRRIGNHKALGLYYPMLGCLVVDVTSPSSFIHELGHCLDNLCGGRFPLSDLGDFHRTYSLYKNSLMKELSQDYSEYRKLAKSKSKYNLEYYLLHTEAFARCFEIYVARVLGYETSLCKMDENLGWAYPKSKELTESIKEFFDTLLATVNKDSIHLEEEGAAA